MNALRELRVPFLTLWTAAALVVSSCGGAATPANTPATANKRIDIRDRQTTGGRRLNAAIRPSAQRTMIVAPGKMRASFPFSGAVQPHAAMSDAAVKIDVTSAL